MLAISAWCACSDRPATLTDYDQSVDVPCQNWRNEDTLFFPITVTDTPEIRTPLLLATDYHMDCCVRMGANYKYANVPMQLILQQTDTTSASAVQRHVIRNLLRQEIAPTVRNAQGQELGSTWGSLIQYEGRIEDVTIRFDTAGTYQMLLIPAIDGATSLEGIHSIGLSLTRAARP